VPEEVFAASPISAAGGKVIASPFQFYTTGEDNLRIVSVNSLVGVSLKIQGRLVDSRGVIGAAAWDHTPNTDRSVKSNDYPLGIGAVLNLTVFANAGSPQIGQTFVIVQLVRGLGAAAIVLGTLLQGYVTSSQGLGWPGSPIQSSVESGGYIRTIVGTVPALGVNLLETVPTNARWQLLQGWFNFATSAVVGNRLVNLEMKHSAVRSYIVPPSAAQGPTVTGTFSFGAGMPSFFEPVQPVAALPLPTDTALLAGDSFGTTVANLDPGDAFMFLQYTVREWLEVR
jgi:hypothetical protein